MLLGPIMLLVVVPALTMAFLDRERPESRASTSGVAP
jgi:hypothetical protein